MNGCGEGGGDGGDGGCGEGGGDGGYGEGEGAGGTAGRGGTAGGGTAGGWSGGDAGGSTNLGGQSPQSVPRSHRAQIEPSPPSSHSPSKFMLA